MNNKLAGISAATLLAASLSTPASAAFIVGTVSFSDGLATLGNIVSDLTTFDINAPTVASGGTLDFLGVAGLTATGDIDTAAPSGPIYSVDGFTFTLAHVFAIVPTGLSCFFGGCTDSITFEIGGTITGVGFDPTAFLGTFTANGSCFEERTAPDTCQAGSQSGTWSSSIASLGRAPERIPVPATLELLGLALAGLGWMRRPKA